MSTQPSPSGTRSWPRRVLKGIKPVEALYVSLRATPTLHDGLAFALYRLLVWFVDRMRFSRRISVAVGGTTRRLHVTFALNRADGPPAILTLPVQPQAYWTLLEVFSYERYRPLVPMVPRTIVDAGANIGLTAIYLHGLFPTARFVCIEPDPANLCLLRRNLAQNGVPHAVVEAALGRAEGLADFRVHRAISEYSSAGPTGFPESEYRRITVAVKPLGAVLSEAGVERVGLLKIDIEGGEFDVLGSGTALPPLDYLVGEFHAFAGNIGQLADVIREDTGLELLRQEGGDDVSMLHFGRPRA